MSNMVLRDASASKKSNGKKSFTESGCADSEHSAKEESTQLQSLFPESQVP